MRKVALLIHGPFAGNCFQRIAASLSSARASGHGPYDRIIVSTYVADAARTGRVVDRAFSTPAVELVACSDLANPGFFNINRQVHVVQRALQLLDADCFVIKLRNDQCVNFSKLTRVLAAVDYLRNAPDRLITTNCYTRSDRLYHPSDMFLCATQRVLGEYYALPYQTSTHMDCVLSIARSHADEATTVMSGAPEELLFRNYLAHRGWAFADTHDDSLAAIRRYCQVVNTWDIGLTWSKRRTPFRRADTLVLPYSFTMPPFPDGPVETARCWSRHHIHGGRPTFRDGFYLGLSKTLWRLSGGRIRGPNYLKNRLIRIRTSISKHLGRRAA